MKKLNRKGFTLIELLAVIVIMAIILVVTVPNIIQSINDARANSIHNLAVATANTYNTAYGQDLVASAGNKVLGNIPESISSNWQCIGSLKDTKGTDDTTDDVPLSEILGLSSNDVVLTGTVPNDTGLTSITASYCSAIRLNNGSAEVILVAKNGGWFYVAQKITYAYSKATAAGQNNAS